MRKFRTALMGFGLASAAMLGACQDTQELGLAVNTESCESLAGFVTEGGALIYIPSIDAEAAIPACAQAHSAAPDDLNMALYLVRAMDAADEEGDDETYAPKITEIMDSINEDESGAKDYVQAVGTYIHD